MREYAKADLEEGRKALTSLMQKSEKALTRLATGTSQHTTLTRRMKAFTLAGDMVQEKLEDLSQR